MLIFLIPKEPNRSLNYWINHYIPLTTFLDKAIKVLLCISGPRDSDVISEVDICRLSTVYHIYLYMNRYIYIHLSIHADIIIFVDVGIPYIYTHVYTHLYAHTKAESLRQDAKERKNICTPYIDRILDDQNESRWQPSVALAPQI